MKLTKLSYFVFFVFYSMSSFAEKSFFKDISNLLPDQKPRLSYGVAVTDFDNDGADEFIVTGFGYENLALGYDGNSLQNKIKYLFCIIFFEIFLIHQVGKSIKCTV